MIVLLVAVLTMLIMQSLWRFLKNLVVKVPDNVSDEEAAFTTVGSIALQGIRLAEPKLGETFLVLGLGLFWDR
ncbi:MAG: hypothetical protein U5L01_10220 [Rheinheimera sp.]|nr:hypothetical protein [Rheinheimera sp.]